MLRAVSVVATHDPDARTRDTVLLDQDARRAPRGMVVGLRGTVIELALPAGTRLGPDDRVLLDDGSAVDVVASPEPLLEVRAKDPAMLARAAWLLGDHHIPVEIHGRYLRVSRTDYVSGLLRTLDVSARQIEAPFEPEGGAYDHVAGTGA